MKSLPSFVRTLCVFAFVTLVSGCATTPADDTNLLVSAGFKIVPAVTAGQQNYLNSLAPRKMTIVKQGSTTHYIYPDTINSQIYVGGAAQYQVYKQLRTEKNLTTEAEESGEATNGPWGDGWVSI